MKNKSRTPELSETVRVVHRKLLEWKQEIEHSEKPLLLDEVTISWKGKAAILQYNATVKIARLGANLLEKSMCLFR